MATSQGPFKWTDDKCFQEVKCSLELRNCDSSADKLKLYESVRRCPDRCIYNPGRGIWSGVERSGKTGQGKESLISTFACYFTAAAGV